MSATTLHRDISTGENSPVEPTPIIGVNGKPKPPRLTLERARRIVRLLDLDGGGRRG